MLFNVYGEVSKVDIFLEKIVKQKKSINDYAVIFGLVILSLCLILFIMSISALSAFFPLLGCGIIWIAYILIKGRNIEYEYIVTNGDLDIDKIIAQRKRKRIFSATAKDFEIIAKKSGPKYDYNVQNIKKKLITVSSLNSPDVYFGTLVKDGEKTVVFFEPTQKMLESLKKYNPMSVFID